MFCCQSNGLKFIECNSTRNYTDADTALVKHLVLAKCRCENRGTTYKQLHCSDCTRARVLPPPLGGTTLALPPGLLPQPFRVRRPNHTRHRPVLCGQVSDRIRLFNYARYACKRPPTLLQPIADQLQHLPRQRLRRRLRRILRHLPRSTARLLRVDYSRASLFVLQCC